MVEYVDVVLVAAIAEEFTAAKEAFSASQSNSFGVLEWIEKREVDGAPYTTGIFHHDGRPLFSIGLAVPTRMGGIRTSSLSSVLAERLQPKCLVMCGVCAGNPADLALGDVVISELAYQYDEGKRESDGFVGDHRQSPISPGWLNAAQRLSPQGLPSYGAPTAQDARFWLLERLYNGNDPRKHPARSRYIGVGEWRRTVETLESEGLIEFKCELLRLTEKGRAEVVRSLTLDVDPPLTLPFNIMVGPIASGNVVVKDGLTWDMLRGLGVRSVLGLEMEAATIGEVARARNVREWIVIKGVMDHADPKKDDRFKPFAARASAEVLRSFLVDRFCEESKRAGEGGPALATSLTPGWQPRTLKGPFHNELEAAITAHAPRYQGLYNLALSAAIKAYEAADQANVAAENVRASLGKKIGSAHSGRFARKKIKILRVATVEGKRELVAKIWDSHDEYLGEAVGDQEDGLGITSAYAVSQAFTPQLQASYAGRHEQGKYGHLGVYTFPDRGQFAGEWMAGHPKFGYREYFGTGNTLNCDFYLGSMEAEVMLAHGAKWHPEGEGIAVDAASRHVRCGQIKRGVFKKILFEFDF